MPEELVKMERQVRTLEIEKESLKLESKSTSDKTLKDKLEKRLKEIEKELADLSEQYNTLKAEWEQERQLVIDSKLIKEEIKKLEHEAEIAEKQTDYNKVAEIRYGKIPELKKKLEEIEKEINRLNDNELPIYTILVPVYKEKNVVEILLEGLSKIDYPRERVEILILLEEDDTETIKSVFESIEKHDLSKETFRPIVVPHYLPKTKPKACNYGLIFARGKYLVIYDAEDIPEPNQLKMAIATFNKLPQNYICLQARLNYFNKDYNFLTRMFTLEYSYWFDYMLPGLSKFKLPIPLGGTSNHFKTEKLLELGGWDPYNTTEDADLGIRAYMRGYKVGVINSTTYEEANAKVWNWIRQRSRWIKGYMQTWLVYARKPLVLIKKTGFSGFLSFNLLIGGTPLTFLINPILWFIFFLWLLTKTEIVKPIFPSAIFYMALTNLAIGNFMGIYLNMLSIFKRKNYNLIFYAILNPLYWILHSIAAYKALWQLFTKPFYWEKTEHGISKVKQQ